MLIVQKLMDEFHLDPAKRQAGDSRLERFMSAASQQAAKAGGLQIGSIRKSPPTVPVKRSRPCNWKVPARSRRRFRPSRQPQPRIGFPVVVDSVPFTADISRPGQLKMSLTLFILEFDLSKEAPCVNYVNASARP